MRCFFLIPLLLSPLFAQTDVSSNTPHVQAELESNIKAKKAKPGEKVKAKTISPLTLADGTVVPVASEIYGQVTAVTNDASGSSLAIAFTQLEINNKKTPVKFSIRAAMQPGGGLSDSSAPSGADSGPMGGGRRNIGQAATTPAPSRGLSAQSTTEGGGEVAAKAGSVMGMPGVKLDVDDTPTYASTFKSAQPNLQLSEGLNLMLAIVQ